MSRYGLWSLFGPASWLPWAILFTFFALVLGGRRGVRVARWTSGLGVLLALGLYALPTGYFLIKPLETRFPQPVIQQLRPAEIIVLAGGERLGASDRSDQPEHKEHGERVVEGAALARLFPEARLWAVGGVRLRGTSPRDVDWMRRSWMRLGVEPSRIRQVGGTGDTCENAEGMAAAFRGAPRPMLLVTSAFHMPRSIACFRAAGLEPIPYPVDYQNGPAPTVADTLSGDLGDNVDRANLALHEWAGLVYYRATGRITDAWPAPAR